MPLPSDEKVIVLSEELLKQFEAIFGSHPGFRPAHAKGTLLAGNFIPSSGATALTNAPHITRPSTPVTVRFSNSTGIPVLPDNDPNANPRGLAIRFHLGEHVHTDIIAHSTDGFPVRTGEEFLEFLTAIASSSTHSGPGPSPVEQFLGSHPAALAYVQTPKPNPVSFATEAYYGVTAFRFTNADGKSCFGRYQVIPDGSTQHLDDETAKNKGTDYLFQELTTRVAKEPIKLHVQVQTASDSDTVNDATLHWPADRPIVTFGTITLTDVLAEQEAEQKKIIFDPIPRVDGIEPSDDPLLELRAAVYLISGRRRRKA